MPTKKKAFLFVSLFYILFTVVPIVPDVTGVDVSYVNLITFLCLFVLYPQAFNNRIVYWFSAYIGILTLYLVFGKPLTIGIGTVSDNKKLLIEIAYLLPCISIFSILYYLNDIKLFKYVSFASLLFLVFSFLYIIPMLVSSSNSLRDYLSMEMYDNITVSGIPNYALMHAYVFVLPALLYGLKSLAVKWKWVLISIISLLIYMLINTSITTSLLILLFALFFYLVFDIKFKVRSFVLVSAFMIFIMISHYFGLIISAFDFLIDFFNDTAAQSKMEDFKLIYITGDVDNASNVVGRTSLHGISWEAFYRNFIIGSTPVGGHSSLLDRLGGLGLLGFIPFIMIILSFVRMSTQLIKNSEPRSYYYIGVISAMIMLTQKGLFGQEGWLFMMVLMPGLIISFRNTKRLSVHMKRV